MFKIKNLGFQNKRADNNNINPIIIKIIGIIILNLFSSFIFYSSAFLFMFIKIYQLIYLNLILTKNLNGFLEERKKNCK